jgi:3,4-dihydroxy 2-butanone 4-phosphate synthase
MLTALTPPPPVRRTPWPASSQPVALAFARGRTAILLDERGAVLAFPAATATSTQLHFAIRHSAGLIHAAMPSARLDQLQIPDQWVLPSENSGAGFTVAVDAAEGITTGISARDRAHTLRVLADPATVPADLIRPGHVMPIRCADRGFAVRERPWELAVDLVAAAGHPPIAVACRLVTDEGDTVDDDHADAFAYRHDLPVCESPEPTASTRRHLHLAGVGDG